MRRLRAPGRVRGWFSQDVARANAARATVRLLHQRRQRRDLESYLQEQPNPPIGGRRAGRGGPSPTGARRG